MCRYSETGIDLSVGFSLPVSSSSIRKKGKMDNNENQDGPEPVAIVGLGEIREEIKFTAHVSPKN